MNSTKLTGLAFIALPLLLQIPYTLLSVRYSYPAILRRPAAEILTRFAQGGPELVGIWYLYALLLVPLLLAIAHLPAALNNGRLAAATYVGVASAVVQMAGLLRWTFAVPVLAAAPRDPATLLLFQIQHQLFGVMLGEHIGQILLALWTLGISQALDPRHLKLLGRLAAMLFLLGSLEHLSTVLLLPTASLAPVTGVAFILWSLWLILLGRHLLRAGTRQV